MIRSYLSRLREKVVGLTMQQEPLNIAGANLQIIKGSFRADVDADDAWFVNLVRDKRIVFDVGANVGLSAIFANLYGKPAEVVLIDPNPIALATAASNLILNNMAVNCRFISGFAGATADEDIKFFSVGRGAAGSKFAGHAKTASYENSWQIVKSTTLDIIAASLKLIPDFIKIDVEGAEIDVLKGSVDLASRRTSSFFVEMHSNPELTMEQNGMQVLQWCQQNGYEAWYMKTGELLKDAATIKHRGRCHLLLLPNGSTYPEIIRGVQQGAQLPAI